MLHITSDAGIIDDNVFGKQIICFIAQNYMVCGHGSWNVLCAEYLTCRMSDMLAVLSAASVTCFRGFVNVDLEDSGETDLW